MTRPRRIRREGKFYLILFVWMKRKGKAFSDTTTNLTNKASRHNQSVPPTTEKAQWVLLLDFYGIAFIRREAYCYTVGPTPKILHFLAEVAKAMFGFRIKCIFFLFFPLFGFYLFLLKKYTRKKSVPILTFKQPLLLSSI